MRSEAIRGREPERFPFRVQDLWSDRRQAENEVRLVRAHATEIVGAETPGRCQTCDRRRVFCGTTPDGFARVGCRMKGKKGEYEHIVTLRIEHAGVQWPGCPKKSTSIIETNSAIAAALHRGLDVPAAFRRAEAGPVLAGGGTVYMPGSSRPAYPLAVEPGLDVPDLIAAVADWETESISRAATIPNTFDLVADRDEPIALRNRHADRHVETDEPTPMVRFAIRRRVRHGGAA